ncbi:pentatricopeptide repeat-containing protein [Prunus yedoensis var. nudiflora]|uniref:Pentatricopeptide repeat-containing protein n=1 Tax=Prunus yedoensis var. nudiflora TaxID=2094558 RepID=A0A314XZP7_PRUYE|nr:pentatricopeptide repeat-containing protein [Prunus yedoensis var. nudiflora]
MDAFELLRLMALKGLELNLISYNVVINGLCREGRMNETMGIARKVIFTKHFVLQEEMRRNRLSPNVFNVINAMCKAKNLNRAMEFFDRMRVRGLRPNERTYIKLIDGFSQQGFLN